jgi:very-short-patch-repair endonuclease
MGGQTRKLDWFLAWIASRQKGIVTRLQLLEAGFSERVIDRRIGTGALIPIHPGVYLVGHRATAPFAYEAAAILACGPGALLSHATSARLWRVPVPDGGPIDVTVVGRTRRSLRGVRVHSINSVGPEEARHKEGLPLSSPSLTLLDLAGALSDDQLAAALNEARVLRLVREAELEATLGRHPQRRGAAALRRLLAAERGPRITRSEAERRALVLMRQHGLEPETDVSIGPWRVDFLFRAEGVVVEVDGYRYHSTPERFVNDRRRTADLAARGFLVLSLTWNDLGAEADAAMTRLRRALDRRRGPE